MGKKADRGEEEEGGRQARVASYISLQIAPKAWAREGLLTQFIFFSRVINARWAPSRGSDTGKAGEQSTARREAPVMAKSPALRAHYLVEVGGSQHALPEKSQEIR